jgi:drug/metabolite transporter (DMT)-like permease
MTSKTQTSQPSRLAIWAALISVYIVWGSTYLAIRFSIATIPPFLMAGVRFLVAGAILYIWRRSAGDAPPARIHWRSAAVVGGFLLLGGNGGVVWAEQRVVSGVAALLVGASPLWMVLIDAVRPGGRKPTLASLAGVLVGFAGMFVLINPFAGDNKIDSLGALVLLLGCFLWACGSLYSRNAALPASPLLGTGMEMLVGGAGLMIAGTLAGEWQRVNLAGISRESMLGLLYLIIFGSLVGFASYTWLLRSAPTTLVSTYAYVNPLVAILLGNLLAQEPLNLRVILAASIIIGAVVIITLNQSANKPQMVETPVLSAGDD